VRLYGLRGQRGPGHGNAQLPGVCALHLHRQVAQERVQVQLEVGQQQAPA